MYVCMQLCFSSQIFIKCTTIIFQIVEIHAEYTGPINVCTYYYYLVYLDVQQIEILPN